MHVTASAALLGPVSDTANVADTLAPTAAVSFPDGVAAPVVSSAALHVLPCQPQQPGAARMEMLLDCAHTIEGRLQVRNLTCVLSHLHSRAPVPVLQTGVPRLDSGTSGEPCTNHQVDGVVQLLCLGARGQAERYALAPASCSIWLASGTAAPKNLSIVS